VISLRVNGKPIELESPTPLLDYVAMLGVDRRAIAVEVNGQILERDGYQGCTLQDGDTVEIVRMVGGGASLFATTPQSPFPRHARVLPRLPRGKD
jgi:sulfur carrier protein